MVEFNADGSIRLPGAFAQKKTDEENRFRNTPSIRITKEVISSYQPKKCKLTIELSDRMQRNDFVENIYRFFVQNTETPTKLSKLNEKTFEVEVGSSFRRCSECCSLVNRYREYNDGNLIQKKRLCTYEPNYFFD